MPQLLSFLQSLLPLLCLATLTGIVLSVDAFVVSKTTGLMCHANQNNVFVAGYYLWDLWDHRLGIYHMTWDNGLEFDP